VRTTYCSMFNNGMNDGLIAECWQERAAFWLLSLLKPAKYRLGRVNGEPCVWWKRPCEPRGHQVPGKCSACGNTMLIG